MTLGKRLKELREQQNMTQRQLAEAIGVDFSYLSKIENERLEHTPSVKMLQDLARVLEVDELELMSMANKLPASFEPILGSKEAQLFFRRASQTVKTPAQWNNLLEYLEQQNRAKEDE